MVLFEGERGRKLVGDLPASKWELDTLPDLSSYKRTTDQMKFMIKVLKHPRCQRQS